jgi:MoxR-like ATPase
MALLEDETMTAMTASTIATLSHADAARDARAFELALRARFLEREEEIRGLLLAAIARANILLLGPPGTAKSALTTAFSDALGWSSFVRLMGRTTVAEEVFGPWSLSALENDRFERVTAGYLPTAQVVFLDEVFKANSAILNALLTALNERMFDQGPARISIPLEIAVGASNEYAQDDGLAALYDRFLVRFWVDYLKSESSFEAMLLAESGPALRLDREVIEVLRAEAARVDLSKVIPVITKIRAELARGPAIAASDRRWRQSLSLVRASAALDGRSVATPKDLAVLADCLWDRHEQRAAILAIVTAHRSPALAKVVEIRGLAQAEVDKLPSLGALRAAEIPAAGTAIGQLRKFIGEARAIAAQDDVQDPEVAEEIAKIEGIARQLAAAITKAASGV